MLKIVIDNQYKNQLNLINSQLQDNSESPNNFLKHFENKNIDSGENRPI